MRIVTSIKLVWLSHQTTAFLLCRHVLLCVVLAFWHPRILFLLPFLWIYDAFIREYLLNVFIYRRYLKELSTDILGTTPYTGEQGLIANIVLESSKYELNQQLKAYSKWKKREKKVYLLQYTDYRKMTPSSYNSIADFNIIIVPSNFDPYKIQHATMVAHEYNHIMGHDGYKLELYSLMMSCIGSAMIFFCFIFINLNYWWVVVIGACSIGYLLYDIIVNSEYYKELDADIGAIRYFENLDKFGSCQIPTRKGRTVLQEVAYDIAYNRRDARYIKPLWPFLREDDKARLLKNVPMLHPNKWNYNYKSTGDIYMVSHDIYTSFALLLLFVLCIFCCIKLCDFIVFHWYCLFLAIIPFILLIISIINSNQLWKKKQELLKKIGCK